MSKQISKFNMERNTMLSTSNSTRPTPMSSAGSSDNSQGTSKYVPRSLRISTSVQEPRNNSERSTTTITSTTSATSSGYARPTEKFSSSYAKPKSAKSFGSNSKVEQIVEKVVEKVVEKTEEDIIPSESTKATGSKTVTYSAATSLATQQTQQTQQTKQTQHICILCSGSHKFSPFNVTVDTWAKLPELIPMMVVDEKSGHYNVCAIRNNEKKDLNRLTIESIRQIIDDKQSLINTNDAIYWTDGIELLSEDGLIALLINRPSIVDETTIRNLLKMIYCPQWWDNFLTTVASTQIKSDIIADTIERANIYRDLMFESARDPKNGDKYSGIFDFKFPKFNRIMRSLREQQKRINEETQDKQIENKKSQKESDERQRLIDSLAAIEERERLELENLQESTEKISSFRDEFVKELSTMRSKGTSYEFISALNPDPNSIATLVQNAGELSELRSGVNTNDKIKKAAIWDYYLVQEKEINEGTKYRDYGKGQKKSADDPSIPTIPEGHADLKKSEIKRPKPLLTLNTIQKKQYENIWKEHRAEIASTNVKSGTEFVLDPWQSEAIDHTRSHRSHLITGPTSGGKTFVMMKAMDNIINGSTEQIVIYVSPTFHLAYQTYANVMVTFPKRTIAMITAELITIPSGANIFIGTAPQLLNFFVTTKKRFQVGIFDEIHVASSNYIDSTNKNEVIRAKAYSRLISRCENQFIGASATVQGVDEMRKFIAYQMNFSRTPDQPQMSFTDIHHVNYSIRAVPLSEYRFVNNRTIQSLVRNSETGIEIPEIVNQADAENDTVSEVVPIEVDADINSENLFKLLIQMKKREMTPTIVFDYSDDITWKSYVDFINFLEHQESTDYVDYTHLIEKTNETIDKFNTDRDSRMESLPESDNKDSTKMCDGKKGNSRREAGLRVIVTNRNKTFENMISNAKNIFIRSLHRYNTENVTSHCDIPHVALPANVISRIAQIFGTNSEKLIQTYPNIHISQAHVDMMVIIRRLEDTDSDNTETIMNISTDKGSYFRFANSCGTEQLKAIREPGSDEKSWKQRKMMISLAEAQNINPKYIDGIIDVVMRGLDFGIAIIIPTLPFIIQNIILNNLRTKNMGIVFASESMSMGINYPLRSVVIKSSSGNQALNPAKMIQMAGRCGRRGKDTQAHVVYWGITNSNEAHSTYVPPLTDFNENFFVSSGDDSAGSMIEDHLTLAVVLGNIYNTFYYYEERKKPVRPVSSTKNGGRVKQVRHNRFHYTNAHAKYNSSSDVIEHTDEDLERKKCEARAANNKMSRSQYIRPTILHLASHIGYTESQTEELADMICNIDADIVSETYSIDPLMKARDVGIIMNMLIELHNCYSQTPNTGYLTFIKEMVVILQIVEYRLIKIAGSKA